jgi:hypothetical protein
MSISTTTSGASIYFTLDGTEPTASSYLYSSPLHIWLIAGKTVKAIAIKDGQNSAIGTLSGTFSYPPLKTGQTGCYDASNNVVACSATYQGQDGQEQKGVSRSYTSPTQHPTYTEDYTTTDNATGLVWKTCTQGLSSATCGNGTAATMNWQDAQTGANGCGSLNSVNGGAGYAGRKDWRLPSIVELATLINVGTTPYSIDTNYFPNIVADSKYWTVSSSSIFGNYAWYVDFTGHFLNFYTGGEIFSNDRVNSNNVRCVSGYKKEDAKKFIDNGNGTVQDIATNLLWQKCSMGYNNDSNCSDDGNTSNNTATWLNAISYCNSLNTNPTGGFGGKTSWRLPNINELHSISIYKTSSLLKINTTIFPNTQRGYWSSSIRESSPEFAYVVAFEDPVAVVANSNTTSLSYVRCVTDP